MKKRRILPNFSIACCVIILPLLTSCVDIYQHICMDKNGEIAMYVHCTMSKGILGMANAMGGTSGSLSYDDFSKDMGKGLSEQKELLINGEAGIINTRFDIGGYCKGVIDSNKRYKNTDSTKRTFIPEHKDKKWIIPLDFSGTDLASGKEESDKFAYALLSSAKYTLSIAKTVVPKLSCVSLRKGSGESLPMDFLDTYDSYLIEVPLPLLLDEKIELVIE